MAPHFTILVIEDEPAIRQLLGTLLKNAGYEVILCEETKPVLEILRRNKIDLLLLDWMLPKMSGIDFIRKLKQDKKLQSIPVIMLTARAEENCKIDGLTHGADDYITKPFSPRELIARIKTILRRHLNLSLDDKLQVSNIILDLNNHSCAIDNQTVEITPLGFRLLQFFMTHANITYSRATLLDQVWNDTKDISERAVDAEIKRLRKVLGKQAHLIKSIRSIGYQFNAKQ